MVHVELMKHMEYSFLGFWIFLAVVFNSFLWIFIMMVKESIEESTYEN
jgi:hypothetical protein